MAPAKKAPVIQEKYYQVQNDGILGAIQPTDGEAIPSQWKVLKGIVTSADLVAAGVDIKWQLQIGNIEELGYVPLNADA